MESRIFLTLVIKILLKVKCVKNRILTFASPLVIIYMCLKAFLNLSLAIFNTHIKVLDTMKKQDASKEQNVKNIENCWIFGVPKIMLINAYVYKEVSEKILNIIVLYERCKRITECFRIGGRRKGVNIHSDKEMLLCLICSIGFHFSEKMRSYGCASWVFRNLRCRQKNNEFMRTSLKYG